MGKRIIQQRRGRGSFTYRVKKRASRIRVGYSSDISGEWEVKALVSSGGHSTPIAKLVNKEGRSFNTLAANLLYVGQKITMGGNKPGDISKIGDLNNGTEVFNVENLPKDGGKLVRAGGEFAIITGKEKGIVKVTMPSKKEKRFNADSRVTVGRAAGHGRLEKPILKAGKKFFIMKSKSKLWPRTSAVKMNKVDHPFGSGRGKRIKSKIAKRNAPPGKKVGTIRPRRTGRKKR